MSLDDATVSKVEQAVLPKAPDQTLASFKRSLKRTVLKLAPRTAEEAHERGLAERRVIRNPSEGR
jgi:hypothetical protein